MEQQVQVVPQPKARAHKGPDFSAVGPEHDNHAHAWRDVMDWTRLEIDTAQLKQSFIDWARTNRDPEEMAHWDALPAWHYITVGRMAYCMLRGATPPDGTNAWLDAKLAELMKVQSVTAEDDAFPDRQLNAAQRKIVEYVNLYSTLEAYCSRFRSDTDEIADRAKKLLGKVQPNQQMLKRLYEHFKDSLHDAMTEKDNPGVAAMIEPIITVVNILATSTGNAKAIRDSRGATTKSVKQASKAKFKAVDLNTDMASLSPAMIPGSKLVIIYNTKTRKVSFYTAGAEGMGIKGTKLTGYSEKSSYAKTLRKPKIILGQLRDATNLRRVDVIMDYVNGKRHGVSGKLTKDTLVLKVFK